MSTLGPSPRSEPIAVQIGRKLRQLISDGVYPPGSRLPSEPHMAKEFGVSRATLRTALAQLSAENLIHRRQGDGTFVSNYAEDVNTTLGGMLDFVRLIRSSGRSVSIQTVSITERPVTKREADALKIPVDDLVVVLVRKFLADDIPAILATNVIPKLEFRATTEPYDGELELRQFVRRYCGRKVDHAVFNAQATVVDGISAELLQLTPNTPVLQLEATFADKTNAPFVYGNSLLNDQLLTLRFVQTWS